MGYAQRAKELRNGMQRLIEFDGTNERDKADVGMIYEAFLNRGAPQRDARQSKEDHRSEARIKRALDAITSPRELEHQVAPEPGALDLRPRILKPGTQKLVLEQPDFARLLRYVEECQWMPHVVDRAVDLADRLDAAEKVEPEHESKVQAIRKR